MTRSGGFRDLKVWQKAIELVTKVYRFTRAFPSDERFGLTSQLRRAAVSVTANIAEGSGRSTNGEFANGLSVARGSAKEVATLSEVAFRLGFLTEGTSRETADEAEEISRMIYGLQQKLRRRK